MPKAWSQTGDDDRLADVVGIDPSVGPLLHLDQFDIQAPKILPRVAVGGVLDVGDDDVVARLEIQPVGDQTQAA